MRSLLVKELEFTGLAEDSDSEERLPAGSVSMAFKQRRFPGSTPNPKCLPIPYNPHLTPLVSADIQ